VECASLCEATSHRPEINPQSQNRGGPHLISRDPGEETISPSACLVGWLVGYQIARATWSETTRLVFLHLALKPSTIRKGHQLSPPICFTICFTICLYLGPDATMSFTTCFYISPDAHNTSRHFNDNVDMFVCFGTQRAENGRLPIRSNPVQKCMRRIAALDDSEKNLTRAES
jgi:hypothetical protein